MKVKISENQYFSLLTEGKTDSLLIVGDSHSVDVGFTYSSLLKKSRDNVKIIAVGGKTTSWMKDQLKKELSINHYDKVLIWGGTNDAFSMISNSTVIQNLQEMVQMVKDQDGIPYIIVGYDQEIFSIPGKFKPTKYASGKVMDQKRTKFIELQKNIENSITGAVIIPKFNINNSYTGDNIHANSKAHTIVFEIVKRYLDGQQSIIKTSSKKEKGSDVLTRLKKFLDKNIELKIQKKPITFKKEVEDIQIALQFLKLSTPEWGIDGKFGTETRRAIISFQEKYSVGDEEGVIDNETLDKLIEVLESENFKKYDISKIKKHSSEDLDFNDSTDRITIENPGVPVRKYPGDLMSQFQDIVGDYYDEFISDCKSIGLDPLIAVRQLYTESGFSKDVLDCRRKSSAGAMGLAQFMPATWKSYGGGGDPCNVEDALKAYIKFMSELLKRFPNRIDLVLAAYNGGPNRKGLKDALDNELPFTEIRGSIPGESYKYTSNILQA